MRAAGSTVLGRICTCSSDPQTLVPLSPTHGLGTCTRRHCKKLKVTSVFDICRRGDAVVSGRRETGPARGALFQRSSRVVPAQNGSALLFAAVLLKALHIPHTDRQTQRLSACARAVSSAQTDSTTRPHTGAKFTHARVLHGESENASEGHFAFWHFFSAPACS